MDKNRFLICCHDFLLIGTRYECDRLSCKGKHMPVFNLYYHKVNNEYFYCLNRDQIGQYWLCEDRDVFCPDRCDKCNICKDISDVFTELKDSCFFYPKTDVTNNHEEIPYQPILWRIFTSVIDKNNKRFRIEIGKSIPNRGSVLNYGKTCYRSFISFLRRKFKMEIQNHCDFCSCYYSKDLIIYIKNWKGGVFII